ncbi:MAG: energy-coupled thiamine transporter ThiT [Oscillospiraceae bacterium]|nr:energy-coupled thiamine transporter ThiT [Oscillospiraceae bacterium]
MENRNTKTSRLVFSAIMIAVGTVLSLFKIDWAFGGGITICAMLPLVVVSWIYGTKWGIFTAFVFSVLQCLLGIDNVQYATSAGMAVAIILLDYIIAYTVIGFAGIYKNGIKNKYYAVVSGICTTFFARFICHFITGWMIWDALWPNEFGMAAPVYSLCYNGSYMLAEAVITSVVAVLLLKKKPELFSKN